MTIKKRVSLCVYTFFIIIFASSVWGLAESIAAGNLNVTDASPGNNTFLSGSQTISITINPLGNAAIGANITNVTFYLMWSNLSYANVFSTDTTFNQSSYSVSFDTTSVADDFNLSVLTVVHNGTDEVNFSGETDLLHGGIIHANLTIDNTAPNITINYPPNTNTTSSGNFSVNYTFVDANPTSCSIKAGAQTITNTTNSSTGDNATFELGGGNHGISATCTDDAGNSASKTGNRIIIDDVSPYTDVLQFRDTIEDEEQTSIGFGDPLKIDCNPKDNITAVQPSLIQIGVVNPENSQETNLTGISTDFNTLGEVVFTETRFLGTFRVFCHLFDYAGNSNKTNKSFDVLVKADLSGGAFSNPDFRPPVATKIVRGTLFLGEISPDGIINRLMAKDASIVITVEGIEYTITVTDFTSTSADLTVGELSLTLNQDETKEVDIDADGTNEISIKLYQIFQKKADLEVKHITTKAAPIMGEQEAEETVVGEVTAPQKKKRAIKGLAIGLGVIIFVLVILIALHFIRGKRDDEGEHVKFTRKDLGLRRGDDFSGDSFDTYHPSGGPPSGPPTGPPTGPPSVPQTRPPPYDPGAL